MPTITASGSGGQSLAVATMVQTGYGERDGQAPRSLDIGAPIGTQVAGGAKHAVVAAFLAQHNGGERMASGTGRDARDPLSTLTGAGAQQQIVAAHLTKFQTGSTGSDIDAPAPTITANSYLKRPGGAAARHAQRYERRPAADRVPAVYQRALHVQLRGSGEGHQAGNRAERHPGRPGRTPGRQPATHRSPA